LLYPLRIPKKYVFQFSNKEEQELFIKNIQDFQTIEIEEKEINDLLSKLTINEFGQIKYIPDWNKEKRTKFVKKVLKMEINSWDKNSLIKKFRIIPVLILLSV
jgi:hypothetical protein